MESGPLLPCGGCVPERGGEPAVPSGAPDGSVWIVTVRIFFGPGAAGMAGATVETDGMAAGGEEAWPALGFDAVVAGIAGAGAAGGVDIAGLLDDRPPE